MWFICSRTCKTMALPSIVNPFTDTRSPYVLRALNADIMIGIGSTLFDPNYLLTCEMAAHGMVKRLLKKYNYPPEGVDDAIATVMGQCEMWVDINS